MAAGGVTSIQHASQWGTAAPRPAQSLPVLLTLEADPAIAWAQASGPVRGPDCGWPLRTQGGR